MSTRIRLTRGGAKKRPFYRIVVTDSRTSRDGAYIEKIGTYNPLVAKENPERLVIKKDRLQHWLKTGATPSERVEKLLSTAGLIELSKKTKSIISKKVAKRQAEAAAKAKADAEAAAAAEAANAETAA
jgi:small subunit ribosomal protein S16